MTSESSGYDLGGNDVPVNIDTILVDPLPAPPQGSNPDFNPEVFWSVNAFILFLICLSGIWCCFVQKYFFNESDRLNQSDEIYRARRRRRLEDRNTESPDKRRRKLLASFAKHKVQMTVKEEDLIKMEDNDGDTADSSTPEDRDDDNFPNDNDIETGDTSSTCSTSIDSDETGHLKLHDRTGRLVPNCCAVCLSGYKVGDVVTWSSNPACIHAFHRDCVVDWLVKMQPETPCPFCRQEFTDLEMIRKEREIKWIGTSAFDFGAIQLWQWNA